MGRLVLWMLLASVPVGGLLSAAPPRAAAPPVDFERDVRPIFAKSCLKCHGPARPKADLNLTDRATALQAHAVVPGKPEESRLLERVAAADPKKRMPPAGEPLSAKEIETLRRWIAAGAPWPLHWAYRPLTKPAPPRLKSRTLARWCRTPIDRFIAHRLEESGLAPSPEADRRTLIRRLYFNLLGLPPSPAEVDAFVADTSPEAYEKLVDRLLASPHYGERWARHWMDLVHFAETHGHDQDRPREHAWPYRDYLIRSFNRDTPYGRFVEEQVAGDVLFPDDPWATVATGFLAAGPWDESSLRDIREDSLDRLAGQYLDRDDIITTVFSTFTSTSVHCARCHDHKFDPIPQAEYYALQAVFAGTDRANRPYDPDPSVAQRRRALLAEKKRVAELIARRDPALLSPEVQAQVKAWEKRARKESVLWHVLPPASATSAGGAKLTLLPDRSVLSGGPRPQKDTYTVTAAPQLRTITAVRLEVLTDDSLPMKGPGRQDNGNLHLNEFRVFLVEERSAPRRLTLTNPRADFNQEGWTIAAAIDGNADSAWGIFPEVGKSHWAIFELKEPLQFRDNVTLRFELDQTHGRGHLIGRLRLSATDAPQAASRVQATVPADVAAILATPDRSRSKEQQQRLAGYVLQRHIDDQISALPPPSLVYCGTNQFQPDGSFRPAARPRPVHVLHRGLITQPGAEAQPGTLSLLSRVGTVHPTWKVASPADEGQRRAALARWLSDPKNVLTWRSIANRTWQYHFGQGLVATPNDFGHMGATPTHPELLDWLAVTLQENGGSLKALHRLIVTSAVYRQASVSAANVAERSAGHAPVADAPGSPQSVDADNRLLWRMNRRRLDAESFRDALLVVSGTLDRTMGGPSVKQFIQKPGIHVTPIVDYQNFDVDSPANRRRSVYRFLFRTIPDPFMDAMDCPDGSQLAPKRTESVTALQALATWNDRFAVRQSEHLAARLEREAKERDAQIDLAYRLLFGRAPRPAEREAVRAYADQHGLANACRVLLNTNEFLFVD